MSNKVSKHKTTLLCSGINSTNILWSQIFSIGFFELLVTACSPFKNIFKPIHLNINSSTTKDIYLSDIGNIQMCKEPDFLLLTKTLWPRYNLSCRVATLLIKVSLLTSRCVLQEKLTFYIINEVRNKIAKVMLTNIIKSEAFL